MHRKQPSHLWYLLILVAGLFHSGTVFAQPPATPVIFGSAPLSPSNSTTPALSGSSDDGTTVRIYASGNCQGAPIAVTGPISGTTFSQQVVAGANTSTLFTAQATNAGGLLSGCSSSFVYIHDNIAPTAPTLFGTTPISPAASTSPSVNGSNGEPGATIMLYASTSCTGPVMGLESNAGASFAISTTVFANTTTLFTAHAVDDAGNISPCSNSLSYVNQSSEEICDGIDNDGDGLVDEGFPVTYADNDGDGFGDLSIIMPCDTPGVANADDCNDNDPNIFPGQGCGGCTPMDIALLVDPSAVPDQACLFACFSSQTPIPCLAQCYANEGLSLTCATCVVEFQFCVATQCAECQQNPNSAACLQCMQSSGCSAAFTACSGLLDADMDGHFAPFDCDDNNASVYPGAPEGCTMDGLDNDCDGLIDEDALVDADGDGFTLCDGDCNDQNSDVHPGAVEICDGLDNDCDGIVDNGFPAYFVDNDGDGFGDPNAPSICGVGVPNNTDCDDADPSLYPGAPETCDGLDNDCNGTVDDNLSEDLDGDGFSPCQGDCDDTNATIYPGAPELCDGLDNDCNGFIEPTLYADTDGDGYGDAANVLPCGTPGSTNNLDCDDSDPLITLPPNWFLDADGDGYGVFGQAHISCTQPPGYVDNNYDCDDSDALVFPGQGCTECSPADLALMASNPFVTFPAQACLLGCSNASAGQQCLSNCIAANGLTGPCADCFAAYWFCQLAACPICQEQPESIACQQCQLNSSCSAGFSACSGLQDNDHDGFFTPIDCDDSNAAVNPGATEICDGIDNDCDGVVDEGFDADNDGITDCLDGCPNLFGDIGSPCEIVPGELIPSGIISPACTCALACSIPIVLDLRTDLNSQEASFIIRDEGSSIIRCQGGGFPTGVNAPIVLDCCLPEGCFKLEVFDSGGDGFVSGGYQVREAGSGGRRIIDNFANFSTGGSSSISSPSSFCLPIGDDRLIFSTCDKLTWVNNQYLVGHENLTVSAAWVTGGSNAVQDNNSGYEFWIFDPNGSYSFRRFRAHNSSDGFSPANARRACHMKLNSWVNSAPTPHVPTNVLMNVRIRGRVNGANLSEFGPACRLLIDPSAASCPLIWLQDDPANPNDFSCGVQRNWGGSNSGANKIVAKPPQFVPNTIPGPVRFQFRFRIPGEGICIMRPPQSSPTLYLNWTTGTALQCSRTYEVDVRASKDGGATWCVDQPDPACYPAAITPWGRQCSITINPCGTSQSGMMPASSGTDPRLLIFPNPNNGQLLHFALDKAFDAGDAHVEFVAINGAHVRAFKVPLEAGSTNFTLELNGLLPSGMHVARVTVGDRTYIERLMVHE